MNNLLTKTTLSAAIALTLVACGGSGSSDSDNDNSGAISSGTITGFGSVFVNGVEFETDSATFDVDGLSGTQDDLAIGMVVRVNGTINADGITGDASRISFDDELQGPVASITAVDANSTMRSFVVLGTTVVVDSSSTSFDLDDDVAAGTVFDFDNISVDNNVEISGFVDSSGAIQATRVELKDVTFDANSEVEIKGTISELSGTSFKLGGLNVDASNAELDDLPNGLEDGVYVEVEGTLSADYLTIFATEVEAEDDDLDDSDEFEIEGLVTEYVDDSNFKVNGISVDASNAEREPSTLNIENDLRIEVEGEIVDNVLIASEVKLEDGDIKVEAPITSIDVTGSTFTVSPHSSLADITITVTTGTQLEHHEIEPYTLSNMAINDFVEIRGFESDIGVTAVEIDVENESDKVVLQGNATTATGDATGGTITVLGVTYQFNAATIFEGDDDMALDDMQKTALLLSISATTPQLLKIKDEQPADGIADKIEIE